MLLCERCGQEFASRNRLFIHLRLGCGDGSGGGSSSARTGAEQRVLLVLGWDFYEQPCWREQSARAHRILRGLNGGMCASDLAAADEPTARATCDARPAVVQGAVGACVLTTLPQAPSGARLSETEFVQAANRLLPPSVRLFRRVVIPGEGPREASRGEVGGAGGEQAAAEGRAGGGGGEWLLRQARQAAHSPWRWARFELLVPMALVRGGGGDGDGDGGGDGDGDGDGSVFVRLKEALRALAHGALEGAARCTLGRCASSGAVEVRGTEFACLSVTVRGTGGGDDGDSGLQLSCAAATARRALGVAVLAARLAAATGAAAAADLVALALAGGRSEIARAVASPLPDAAPVCLAEVGLGKAWRFRVDTRLPELPGGGIEQTMELRVDDDTRLPELPGGGGPAPAAVVWQWQDEARAFAGRVREGATAAARGAGLQRWSDCALAAVAAAAAPAGLVASEARAVRAGWARRSAAVAAAVGARAACAAEAAAALAASAVAALAPPPPPPRAAAPSPLEPTASGAPHRVVLIVPFRAQAGQDRAAQLRRFADHIENFFEAPQVAGHIDWRVLVVEQGGGACARAPAVPFNRGKLLNCGTRLLLHPAEAAPGRGAALWAWARTRTPGLLVYHDVDMLPSEELLPWYTEPPPPAGGAAGDVPAMHAAWVCANVSGFGLPYPWYLGGILALTPQHVASTNGFPNDRWGWGGEDDELRERCEAAGVSVLRPPLNAPGRICDLEEQTAVLGSGGRRRGLVARWKAERRRERLAGLDRGRRRAPAARQANGVSTLCCGAPAAGQHGWAQGEQEWIGSSGRILKVVVDLGDPAADNAPDGGNTMAAPAARPQPTIRCFVAEHPLVPRRLWLPCTHPAVPYRMSCKWMAGGGGGGGGGDGGSGGGDGARRDASPASDSSAS